MSLLQNAIYSIEAGIEDYQYGDQKRSISAVRNVYAGILLLLKEKLVRLSPKNDSELLIKKRVIPQRNSNGNIDFVSSGKETVDYHDIQVRFKSLGVGVDWKRLDEIRHLRNDLEHYYTEKSLGLVKEILAKSFLIIRDFLTKELNESPVFLIDRDVWSALLEIEEVFSSEKKFCENSFTRFNWKYETVNRSMKFAKCYFCDSSLIQLVQHEPYRDTPEGRGIFQTYWTKMRCNSCGETIECWDIFFEQCVGELFFKDLYLAATQGGDPPVVDCPECGKATFVFEEGCCVVCDYKPDLQE